MKTYKDFQGFPVEAREDALSWLRGRVDYDAIQASLTQSFMAANDDWLLDTGTLLFYREFVMMLHCWVENGRDDVRAKLAYVEGREYFPLP